jgi:sodium-dependent dicarboxylate transporter 2/3/5
LHKHGKVALLSGNFPKGHSTEGQVMNDELNDLILFYRTFLHGREFTASRCGLHLTTMPNMQKIFPLLIGPILFAVLWGLNPFGFEIAQAKVTGVVAWMLVWWISESVPMAVTSLLPIMLFPLLGVMGLEKTCLSYSNRFVFLFLGGFLIALAMEKWNLHRRLALSIVNKTGTSANTIIFGFMLASFSISMWISNTATTLMMLPIASSVVLLLANEEQTKNPKGASHFATALMLSIAYGSSIGGIGTLVGSPPNASMAGILDKSFACQVSFFDWMKYGFPFALVFLLVAYWLLVRVIFPNRLGKFALGHAIIQAELSALGKWTREEKIVFGVFIATALLWILQEPIAGMLKPTGIEFSDTAIAIIMGSSLFIFPSEQPRTPILEWRDTDKLPWGVLLMFGGGMSLAAAFDSCGLVSTITQSMQGIDSSNLFLFVSALCAMGLLITALMSNIAMVNIFVPIVASLAMGAGISPEVFAIPVTIAASCDFMFPMSTPPNAIAYSSGYIRSKDMLKAGVVLNFVSLLLLMGLVWLMVG